MADKTIRLLAIKELISQNKIGSQEQLLNLLEKKGLNYTQATLSRDLKFLKVNKISNGENGYIFELPEQHSTIGETLRNNEPGKVKSIQFANNLGVIKTMPGFAPGIASLIDVTNPFEIIGTIAGDDTILIIPHENVSQGDVFNTLKLILPEIKEKRI